MTISFNTIPSNTLVPLFYAEMDNSMANSGNSSLRTLLIAQVNDTATHADIGKLVLMHRMNDYYRAIVQKVEESKGKFSELEAAEFGFDHAMVGMLLLQRWSFPDSLCQAVLHHHDHAESDGGPAPLPCVINLGNFLAKNSGVGFNDYRVEDLSVLPSAAALGLQRPQLDELAVRLAEHFEIEREIFRLKT